MKKKNIKFDLEVTYSPDYSNGLDSRTLTLGEAAAHRVRNDILLVAKITEDKTTGCDDLVCVKFRCGFDAEYEGADDTFRPYMERINVFSDSFVFGVYDEHSMDEYEVESVCLDELEEAMRKVGWLPKETK